MIAVIISDGNSFEIRGVLDGVYGQYKLLAQCEQVDNVGAECLIHTLVSSFLYLLQLSSDVIPFTVGSG